MKLWLFFVFIALRHYFTPLKHDYGVDIRHNMNFIWSEQPILYSPFAHKLKYLWYSMVMNTDL